MGERVPELGERERGILKFVYLYGPRISWVGSSPKDRHCVNALIEDGLLIGKNYRSVSISERGKRAVERESNGGALNG